MNFEDLVGAIRATDSEDPELAAVTQLRLRRSLEVRARGRHQLAGILTAIAILFGGTVSWALATGRVTSLWAPMPLPRATSSQAPRQPAPAPPRRVHRAPDRAIATVPAPEPPPETLPPPLQEPVEPPAPPARPAAPPPQIVAPVAPVEALYRKAHELHFRGGDPMAALAAWDAYLDAEPAGRFSVEARYNRAIVLVRLHRYAEARAVLEPFARGEVEPEGYRQSEAERLVERLAQYR